MRYLLAILIIFAPLSATALTGPEARFDWSLGHPAITANATSECNDTATARFDWSGGQPTIVLDATANCTTAAGGTTSEDAGIYWFD